MTATAEISHDNAKTAKAKLPDGWRWVRLGDICEVSTGGTPSTSHPEYYGGDVRWLKSGDIKGTYILEVPNRITPLGLANSNARVHPPGSVMIALSGQGKTRGTSAILRIPCACSQSVAALLPSNEAIPEIIHFALVYFYEEVRFLTGDNERTGLNLKIVGNIEIPLPPLAEQKRIAGILKEQMAAVERARASAEAQLQAAENLPAAYLRVVFDNGEFKSWPKKRLGDIAKTSSGSTPSRGRSDYFGGTIPWVKTGELRDGFILDTEEKVTGKALKECSLPLLPAQTLLVAMYGQGQTRGRTGLLTQPMTTNQACFAVLPNPTVFDSAFLQWWFRHSYARLRQETESRGGNQPNLNGIFLREQEVQLPPLADQRRIAAQLSSQMASAERLRQVLTDQLAAINKLPAALLREAFSGRV
jgi:type I restriction enzyme S subunit